MILLDSSALIEFYRPLGSVQVRKRVSDAVAADQGATNGIIQVEVLSFAKGDKAIAALKTDFRAFHWLDLTRKEYDLACVHGALLRARGTTVPATDLIIAASAITAKAILYHLDHHFDEIAAVCELDAVNLST